MVAAVPLRFAWGPYLIGAAGWSAGRANASLGSFAPGMGYNSPEAAPRFRVRRHGSLPASFSRWGEKRGAADRRPLGGELWFFCYNLERMCGKLTTNFADTRGGNFYN